MATEAEIGVLTTDQPWSTATIKKLAMLARLLMQQLDLNSENPE